MKSVLVPTTDVNSETCTVVEWHVDDGAAVRRDELIVTVETSKMVIEVVAPCDGFLLRARAAGDEMPLGERVAYVFDSPEALAGFQADRQASAAPSEDTSAAEKTWRATRKAEELANQHGIDLAVLYQGALITTKHVEAALAAAKPQEKLPCPSLLETETGVERILIIGGGLGATQVLDILDGYPSRQAVGMLDDSPALWGNEHRGVPIVGGSERLAELFQDQAFDSAIVAISTSVRVRVKFREMCERLGIPMANAIDKTCKIASDVTMGTGNVICAFCHFGAGAMVGHNNFISANNSYDHHTVLGNDMSTGPGCMSSAIVTFGDRIRLGTGIFFEPYIKIGDDVQISSGAIIRQSIPAAHIVKAKTGQTVMVPAKR